MKRIVYTLIVLSLLLLMVGCDNEIVTEEEYQLFFYHNEVLVHEELKPQENLTWPADLEKTGYNFLGWNMKNQNELITKNYFDDYVWTGDIFLYTNWELITYKIVFHSTHQNIPEMEYTVESEDLFYPQPLVEDMTFAGWFEDENIFGDPVFKFDKEEPRDLELYDAYTSTGATTKDIEYVLLDDNYEESLTGTNYGVRGGEYFSGDFVSIPKIYRSKPVTTIMNRAFYSSSLEGIDLPEGILRIGREGFWGSSKLNINQLPSTIEFLDYGIFNRAGIEFFVFPKGIDYIPESMFSSATKMISIELHDEITKIEDDAFYNSGLLQIDLPPKLTYIGYGAFDGIRPTVDGVDVYLKFNIPSTVTYIGPLAFAVSNISEINIPEDSQLEEIGYEAFFNVNIPELRLPDSLKIIGESPFIYTNYLTHLYVGSGIEKYGEKVFELMYNLKKITFSPLARNIPIEIFSWLDHRGEIVLSEEQLEMIAVDIYEKMIGPRDQPLLNFDNSELNNDSEHLLYYQWGNNTIDMKRGVPTVLMLRNLIHLIRHYYQIVALEGIGLDSLSTLLVQPSVEEVDSWRLSYPNHHLNMEEFLEHPMEVDSRSYESSLILSYNTYTYYCGLDYKTT